MRKTFLGLIVLYIINVYDNEKTDFYSGPVGKYNTNYLRKAFEHFVPLSKEEYILGPAAILQRGIRSSYILDGDDIIWCSEFEPGLIIIRFAPDKRMEWTALRSPVPDFGGRIPLPEDEEIDDECEDNPQYDLIFTPFDAQLEKEYREWKNFVPADERDIKKYNRGIEFADRFNSEVDAHYQSDPDCVQQGFDRIKLKWGEGIRLELPDPWQDL